jgi:ABC-type dipeptide/oligopeptide/nickel transport system permease component
MAKYIIRRLIQVIPTLWVILTVLFALSYLMPGDPLSAVLGEEYQRLSPEQIAEIEDDLGINRPFLVQYTEYLGRMLQFDLGTSYVQREKVIDIIGYRLPRTLQLMTGGMLVALAIGIPAGIIAAIKQYTWMDHALMIFALIGLSMPVFWQGLIAQLLLTQEKTGIAIFPVAGYGDGNLWYMVLPSIVLGTNLSAVLARVMRSTMLEIQGMDYLKTARAKGLPGSRVLVAHHLRNALIPVLTIIGLQIAALLTGSLVTETIFNWPGLGRAIVPAIQTRDTPVIMGILTLGAVVYIVVNLFTDLLYAVVDPRIRYA